MTPKHVDTEYLYISARLKALEKNFISREKLVRIANAKSGEEAVKVLTENGWGEFPPQDLQALETQIDKKRQQTFDLLYRYAPDRTIADVFRIKYDYHNLKTLIKAQQQGVDVDSLLSDAAMIPPQKIFLILLEKQYHLLPPRMRDAVLEAIDVLARTVDPQLCDLILDNAMFAEMLASAGETQSEFLVGYVRLLIDLSNLKVLVRAHRAQKGYDYLRRAVIPGGMIAADRLYNEVTADNILSLFAGEQLSLAAQAAAKSLGEKTTLSALDMACDNALISYVRAARFASFGEAQVIAYLVASEAELTAVRTVFAGRAAGLSEQKIMERLRVSYV